MKHGLGEFLPGTLLYREADKALAIVISAQVKLYPGPWHQLHVLLLTNNGQLVQDDREIDHIWHRGPRAWKVVH